MYTKNRNNRVMVVAILMMAALLMLVNQLFHDGDTAEAVDIFFIFIAYITFFAIVISSQCPPFSRCSYSFNRRPPPPSHR